MSQTDKYLYCIIPCVEGRTFPAAGIGSGNARVGTICDGDLAVVASDSDSKHYERTRPNMLAHEKVLEAVMKEFAMLPVRFGTVTSSGTPVEDVQLLLKTRSEEFHGLLDELGGKVELGLKVYWRNEKEIYEEIVGQNEEVRRLRNALAKKGPAAGRMDAMRLGELVKAELDRRRSEEAGLILSELKSLACNVRENDILLDRMVLNAAFLLERDREGEFDRAIGALDERFAGRLILKYVGPVPPYNFVNVIVNWKDLAKEG